MIIRSTWTLTTITPVVLPRSYGLELVKDLHRRMGLAMGEEAIPSITCSGLLGKITPCQDFVSFHPEEPYQLVLSGLQEVSAKAIAHLELSNSLEFLGARFAVGDRHDETTSYENLYHSLVANEPEPQRRFHLQFITPTAFSQDRTYLPLPVPTLMFRSWLERWNHFAPVYLGGDELVGYLGGAIALSRHKLQTAPFRVHSGQVTGFKGDVTLQVLNRVDPLLANVASLLFHYAEFAGTGIKTRLGMGQTILRQYSGQFFENP
jgi:CRISPR-associated endoribonuclease Cas6